MRGRQADSPTILPMAPNWEKEENGQPHVVRTDSQSTYVVLMKLSNAFIGVLVRVQR